MILIPCGHNLFFFILFFFAFFIRHILFFFNILFVETLKSSCYLRKVAVEYLKKSFEDHQKGFNTWKFFVFKMAAIETIFWFIYRLHVNYQFHLFFFSLAWIEKDLGRCNFSFFIAIVVECTLIISSL